jgi:hypothetical protein
MNFVNGMTDTDKNLIANIMDSFISETPEKPFLTFCVACKKGVTRGEMKYVNGRVFHPACFEQHGNEFTVINPDILSKNASTKVEIVQLKNLKIRQTGGSRFNNPRPKSNRKKPKRKTKKKRKAKRRPSRRRTSRRRTAGKRRITRKSRRKVKRGSKTRRKVRRSSSRRRRTPTRRKKARRR